MMKHRRPSLHISDYNNNDKLFCRRVYYFLNKTYQNDDHICNKLTATTLVSEFFDILVN